VGKLATSYLGQFLAAAILAPEWGGKGGQNLLILGLTWRNVKYYHESGKHGVLQLQLLSSNGIAAVRGVLRRL